MGDVGQTRDPAKLAVELVQEAGGVEHLGLEGAEEVVVTAGEAFGQAQRVLHLLPQLALGRVRLPAVCAEGGKFGGHWGVSGLTRSPAACPPPHLLPYVHPSCPPPAPFAVPVPSRLTHGEDLPAFLALIPHPQAAGRVTPDFPTHHALVAEVTRLCGKPRLASAPQNTAEWGGGSATDPPGAGQSCGASPGQHPGGP